MKRPLARAFSAAVATVLISSGLLVGAAATSARADVTPPEEKDLLQCILTLDLANCLSGGSALTGTGVVGDPLTLAKPVFGLLPANLLGLVTTDVTWLCNGVPIPGVGNVTQYVPTQAQEGCQLAARTVSSLLGFLPLTLLTDLIPIVGEDEEPELPASLAVVLTANPLLTGTGAIGAPLTLAKPVFGQLPANLLGLVTTDVTWLCDGVPIPGVGNVTQFVPDEVHAGCEIVAKTVSTLLSLLPLELLTNVIPVDEEDPEEGQLTASVAPLISGAKKVGGLLSIDPGTWLGGLGGIVTPAFSYQWYNTSGSIPGATAREYVPRLADAGRPLAATVTATLLPFLPGLGITNVVKVAKAKSKTKLSKASDRLIKFRVKPGAAHPTGKVRLMKGRKTLKVYKLRAADNGQRTVRLPKSAKGRIRAVYLGNAALKRSKSRVLRLG